MVASLASGCSFTRNLGPTSGDDTNAIDAQRVDVIELDAPAECTMWSPHNFVACSIPAPSSGLDLTAGTWTFSTDSGALTDPTSASTTPANKPIMQSDGSTAYLISIASLNVEAGATLQVIGAEPLIVASWDTIMVAGAIDVGSTATRVGAGSSPQPQCAVTPWSTTPGATAMLGQDEVPTTGGSGGGGGGALDGSGGGGGSGDSPEASDGGFGGVAVSAPAIVRGGCSGANSGKAGPGDTGDPNAISVGGAGGGAVELAAKTAIAITGRVLGGGGGGGGSPLGSASGGGGGGAGGLLAFDAPAIAFTGATVAANGGGGGASGGFAETGNGGQDGQPSGVQAMGGAAPASACAEAGQLGGAGAIPNGASSTNRVFACGGSGGGGAVGFILTWGVVTKVAATISPADMPGPS